MIEPVVRGRDGQRVALGWLAVVLGLVAVAAWIGAVAVALADGQGIREAWANGMLGVPFGVVGGVTAARQPRNPIAWMLVAIGVLVSGGALVETYEVHGYRTLGPTGTVTFAAWVGEWYWLPMNFLMFVAVPSTFPSGSAASPRARRILRAAAAAVGAAVLGSMFQSDLAFGLEGHVLGTTRNPVGWLPWPDFEETVLFLGVMLLVLTAIVSGLVTLVRRTRRAVGEERLQLKLAVFGVSVTAAGFLLAVLIDVLVAVRIPVGPLFSLMPLSIGAAILRYRLYDIDRIISRSVTYAVVTALLAGLYVGLTLGVQTLLGPDEAPDLLVAAATLVTAASFRPIRARVQRAVDRRFNRARYDADRVVASFADRLRDEVDLGSLAQDLQTTARATFEPRHLSLWLVPEPPR